MKKLLFSKEVNPYYNIALEHDLFLQASDDVLLYLWQNEPSVIIGRNQNLLAECNLNYMQENGIHPVRRLSGGGAVYHDLGNLNFTFITKSQNEDFSEYIAFLKRVFLKLGIIVSYSGRNDLLVKGRKFSGHAYYEEDGKRMYHGTIMVHVDLEELSRALTPTNLKLTTKSVSSVKSRVINLIEIKQDLRIQTLLEAFTEEFEPEEVVYFYEEKQMPTLYKKLASRQWLYAQSPKYNLQLERRYEMGNISLHIFVEDGIIQDIIVNTDSLERYDFSDFEKAVTKTEFIEEKLWNIFEERNSFKSKG